MKKFLAIMAAMVMMVGTAQASGTNPMYISGQFNRTTVDDIDDAGTGGSIAVGVNIVDEWLSVELSYTDFGSVEEKNSLYQGLVTQTFKDSAKATTLWLVATPTIGLIGSMPVKLSIRGGITSAKFKSSETFVFNNSPLGSFSETESLRGGAAGIGLSLGITTNLDVSIDYRVHSFDVGYGYDAALNLETVGLGLTYNF